MEPPGQNPDSPEDARLAALCSCLGRPKFNQSSSFPKYYAVSLASRHSGNYTTFWVQVFGLPLERCTEEVIRRAVRHVGRVQAVKIDGKDGTSLWSVRARVDLSLSEPLQPGQLLLCFSSILS